MGMTRRGLSKAIIGGPIGSVLSRERTQNARSSVWSTIQGDPSHTGYRNSSSESPIPGGSLWEVDVSEELSASPVVTTDAVLVGTEDGRFLAVELENGTQRWERNGTAQIDNPATIDHDSVYVELDEGTVSALDVQTGQTRWRTDLEAAMYTNSGPVLANGTLYTGDIAGNMYAIDAASGEIRWKTQPQPESPKGTIAVHDGRIYLASDLMMGALDAEDGDQIWTTRFEGEVWGPAWGPPTVDEDIYLALGPNPPMVAAFSTETGGVRWTYRTTEKSDLVDRTPEKRISIMPWSPIVMEDAIITADTGGAVASVTKDDGSEQWRYTIDGYPNHLPVATEETVYIPTKEGLVAHWMSSGKVRWRALDGNTPTSPALASDRLIVSTKEGNLIAFGKERSSGDSWGTILGVGSAGLLGLGGGLLAALGGGAYAAWRRWGPESSPHDS